MSAPTTRIFNHHKPHKEGTDANGRAKFKALIARRKRRGQNVRNLERKLAKIK